MPVREELAALLRGTFAAKHVNAAVDHFQNAVDGYQKGEWETSIVKAGKFVEAALKALSDHVKQPASRGRGFKADPIFRALEQTPQGSYDDSIRLTIPRACRFAYDIASNRGGRHDPDEIDPNEMDATALVAACSGVLAEMLRYSQKGALGPDRVRELVAGLVARRYPIIENVEGRLYFHASKKSARDVALVGLWYAHPKRLTREEIIAAMMRHGFTKNNGHVALHRLRGWVDDDGKGNLRLLAPGLKEAEKLIAATG